MTRQAWTAAAYAAVLVGGCSAFEIAPATPATTSEDFNALWDAATQVLREKHFVIDRADRRAGVITTFPLVGRYWFEFWRQDARSGRDLAEGTVQTVYRQVTVTVHKAPAQAGGNYVADVLARTSRSDLPNVRITSTSEAYELFFEPQEFTRGRTTALPEKDAPVDPTGRPVDLGRDARMEGLLKQQIESRAAAILAAGRAG